MLSAKKELFTSSGGGYQISRSVRLRSSASAYFNRTPASAGNLKTWTVSLWVKRGLLSNASYALFGTGANNTNDTICYFGPAATGDVLDIIVRASSTIQGRLTTTQVFRDPSAWYHIVFAYNSPDATASERMKLYVNGVRVTAFSSETQPAQNTDSLWNTARALYFGRMRDDSAAYFDGYMTEINFIDGQALTPSSFGETNALTGVWQPKRYAGTYGTNGFYLNFSDNSNNTATTIGKDYSGNGNNWTPSAGISVTAGATYDSMLDVPTMWGDGGNGRGNYAVLNPIVPTGAAVISGGNLNIVSTATYCNGLSTINLDSGAYYCECVVTTHSAEGWGVWDITKTAAVNTGAAPSGFYGIYSGGATLVSNGSTLGTNAAGTPANGDIIQVAWSNGNVWVGKNNTWYNSTFGTTGNPSTGANPTFTGLTVGQFAFIFGAGNAAVSLSANFGQRPFTYTPPTGFKALNTQNLPTPTISNGAQYMAATLYTGTGASQNISNAVNGISMQPDLVWIKRRNAAYDHDLFDAVRGAGLSLYSSTTAAEGSGEGQDSFNTNGFTVSGNHNRVNISGGTFAAWQWNAGGSTVTNTSGSISAQVRANATAGFSIVTCTFGNGSIGHGLGVAPKMIIGKGRGPTTGNWIVFHSGLANMTDKYLNLNGTAAVATLGTAVSAPTSTLFYGNGGYLPNAESAIFYCFAEVAGYSAFGSYTGNGVADGVFVYLGFRPRFIMIKSTSASTEWVMIDTSRSSYNLSETSLYANRDYSESTIGTVNDIDILSNGFKLRNNTGFVNASQTYIYAAFSEVGFKYALGR